MLERAPGRRRRRARRRRRRLLDGGRHRAAARDRRAVRALRRAPDGRRGARRRRARRRAARAPANCSASRTGSTCGWARSRSRWPPAAASSPAARRSSSTCGSPRGRSCSPPRPCRPPSARRWRRCGCCARPTGRRCSRRRARQRRAAARRAARTLGFAVVAPQALPAEATCRSTRRRARGRGGLSIVTPIVPVLVGDDWKAALLWKALYDAGVFVNTALHPAVPPGGALLRTSVMATHDAATIDRALEVLRARQGATSRPSTGRCRRRTPAERRASEPDPRRRRRPRLVHFFTSFPPNKKPASSARSARRDVDRGGDPWRSFQMRSA